ncbi:hypothetical protein scyTo_0028016, partial [Scyliorhinus torazame]|nr:hypothetical protein [Scyliorhinus torazame]
RERERQNASARDRMQARLTEREGERQNASAIDRTSSARDRTRARDTECKRN